MDKYEVGWLEGIPLTRTIACELSERPLQPFHTLPLENWLTGGLSAFR